MFYMCLPHTFYDLNMCEGLFHCMTHIYYALYFPHIVSVSTLYNGGFLMFFLLSLYHFLKNIFLVFS